MTKDQIDALIRDIDRAFVVRDESDQAASFIMLRGMIERAIGGGEADASVREALEFYATESNYYEACIPLQDDFGKRARQALSLYVEESK